MELKLSPQAIEEYDKAVDYTIEHFGMKTARDFVTEIKRTLHLLSDNPHLGVSELALAHEAKDFRYLVIHPYKLIYYVDKSVETIYVVTLFNTWQDPEKLLKVIK